MEREGNQVDQAQWSEYCKRSKHWAIRVEYGLLHSEAFKSLTYGPGIKLLFWIFEKRRVCKAGAKRGRRKFVVVNEEFSFTYEEAMIRGMSRMQFWRGIRELVNVGFLDSIRQGCGLQRDFSIYKLSARWKRFAQADFEQKKIAKRGWGFFQ